MDYGNVAGEQIGELGQKERRAKFGRKPLVQQHVAVVARRRRFQDCRVDGFVALAATGCDNHVHGRAEHFVGLDRGVVERKASRIGAEPLPRFHLPLVAALGDLQPPVDHRQRMDHVRWEAHIIGNRLRLVGR